MPNQELPMTMGTVKKQGSKYYFIAGRTKKLLPEGILPEEKLRSIVNMEVGAIISNRMIIAISYYRWRPWCVMCYYPPYDIIKKLGVDIQRDLAKRYLEAGILDKAQHDVIVREFLV